MFNQKTSTLKYVLLVKRFSTIQYGDKKMSLILCEKFRCDLNGKSAQMNAVSINLILDM